MLTPRNVALMGALLTLLLGAGAAAQQVPRGSRLPSPARARLVIPARSLPIEAELVRAHVDSALTRRLTPNLSRVALEMLEAGIGAGAEAGLPPLLLAPLAELRF